MKKTKVYEWLQQCNENQLTRLKWIFAMQPVKPEARTLLEAFIRHLHKDCTKEQLFKEVYGKKSFDGNRFRKACFELLRLLEQKAAWLYVEEEEQLNERLRLQFYAQHAWNENYTQQRAKLLKEQEDSFARMHVEQIHYNYLLHHPQFSGQNNIESYSDSLDDLYLLEKLKLLCHAVNERHFTKFSFVPRYADIWLEVVRQNTTNNLLLHLYYAAYQMLADTNKTAVFDTLKVLLSAVEGILEQDTKIIFQYVVNFCIIRINKSDQRFERELFEVFKLYYNTVTEKEISPFRFKNVINLSLKLKEFEYAEFFNRAFGNFLEESIRESTVLFNEAKISFEKKQYQTTLTLLNKVHFDDLTFNLSSRILLTKAFYELKELQFLEAYLESFRIYVLRNRQMNTVSKKLHQDFIKLIKQLMKKEFAGKAQTEKFRKKINAVVNLPDKSWVLEKLEEL